MKTSKKINRTNQNIKKTKKKMSGGAGTPTGTPTVNDVTSSSVTIDGIDFGRLMQQDNYYMVSNKTQIPQVFNEADHNKRLLNIIDPKNNKATNIFDNFDIYSKDKADKINKISVNTHSSIYNLFKSFCYYYVTIELIDDVVNVVPTVAPTDKQKYQNLKTEIEIEHNKKKFVENNSYQLFYTILKFISKEKINPTNYYVKEYDKSPSDWDKEYTQNGKQIADIVNLADVDALTTYIKTI
jgi:hypothetical protein